METSVLITLIIQSVMCIVAVGVAVSNKAKGSQDGGYQLGKFEGTITAQLKALSAQIDRLETKVIRTNGEIYQKLEHEMENHIKEYHSNGK